ncbi:MAG: hypothetical protein ACREOI_08355 [bacterium]
MRDFESACQQTTDKTQREQIALAALSFLLQNSTPDILIEQEINEEINNESDSPSPITPLPEGEFDLDETLCANVEARLADFFPSIFRLVNTFPDPAVAISLLTRARILSQKVDDWRQNDYWTPLFDFLRNATTDQWRQWRSGVIAQQKARGAIGGSQFERSKQLAIYGLQRLVGVPDYRLYLDLCSRLENAIAEGDAYYCVAIALGYWVVKESLVAGHYLRAAGMRHNLGNQLLISGRNAEAINVLELAQQLCNDYWTVHDMSYYQTNVLERLACAYLNRGDAIRSTDHLARYDFNAQQPREQTLHRLGRGGLAMHAGTHDVAEQKFVEARQFAQGGGNPPKDFFNLWSAHVSLGWVCTLCNKPVDALAHLQKSLDHGETLPGFLNADRESHYSLTMAEAKILKNALAEAQTTINAAAALIQGFDLPRRQMQLRLTTASLRDAEGNGNEAQNLRNQAIQIALTNGFDASDIGRLKMAVFA